MVGCRAQSWICNVLWQVLKEEAAALEEQAPKLAAKAVELTKQLQNEEEVRRL